MHKLNIFIIATVALLTACSSAPKVQNQYAQDSSAKQVGIPDFYLDPPAATSTDVHFAGTGSNRDLAMATSKAKLDSEAKLSYYVNGKMKTMTRQYKVDGGTADQNAYAEKTEIVTQKVASSAISGAQRINIKVYQEGSLFRVYVLMKYPLAELNRAAQRQNGTTIVPELDKPAATMREDMQREIRGENDVTPKNSVNIVTDDGKVQTIEMLDISDPAARKARDSALKKPGAVYGQVVLPM